MLVQRGVVGETRKIIRQVVVGVVSHQPDWGGGNPLASGELPWLLCLCACQRLHGRSRLLSSVAQV